MKIIPKLSSNESHHLPYANNKDTDQPVHPHSLISTFVVRRLDSIIPRPALAEISRLYLVSEAEQTGLSLTWSKTPKTGFLVTRLKYQRYLFFWLGSFRDKSNGGGDTNEPRHDKLTKWLCAQQESSLSTWRNLGVLATHWAHSEDSDQTGRMPRLIWVLAGRTLILLVLSCRGSNEGSSSNCDT